MVFRTFTPSTKVSKRPLLSTGSFWQAPSALVPPCVSSRNGALHIAWNWKQTGREVKQGKRLIGLPRWIEEYHHMNLLPVVVRAEYRADFKIYLVFNDGVEATLDFSDWLTGPVFEPLKDRTF